MSFGRLNPPYSVILADPPWKFYNWSKRPWWERSDKNTSRAADKFYDTMTMDEIMALSVGELAANDCALLCWATWPSFPDALRIIAEWGFSYKTMGFVWVKGEGLPLFPDDIRDQMGMGYWTRANTEPCILATRGSPKRLNADVRQVILDRRREHSRKPDCVHARIERLLAGPYLELFARTKRPGWDSWGNETDKFEAAE